MKRSDIRGMRREGSAHTRRRASLSRHQSNRLDHDRTWDRTHCRSDRRPRTHRNPVLTRPGINSAGMRSLLSRLLALFDVSADEADSEPPPLTEAEYDWLKMEYPSYQSVRPPSNPFF